MQKPNSNRKILQAVICLALLFLVIASCSFGDKNKKEDGKSTQNSGRAQSENKPATERSDEQRENDGPNAALCKKIDECGCQSYEDCLASLKDDQNIDKPGVRDCMILSSCKSLCAGDPDACKGGGKQTEGSGIQQRSNCAAIRCSRNSDCPSDCYGGCKEGQCYMF
jgi:hypothetical protein